MKTAKFDKNHSKEFIVDLRKSGISPSLVVQFDTYESLELIVSSEEYGIPF